jgi:hypothetical protein
MRLLRPRFTLRWLLVAVAVAGTALVGWEDAIRRRSKEYSERAFQCWAKAAATRLIRLRGASPAKTAALLRRQAVRRDWYARLQQKWERAARSPWLPVAPDPPPPD